MSAPPPDVYAIKGEMRESRLKFATKAEERVRGEWKKKALVACDLPIKAYWVCRQEQGLMVVFKCRTENAAMQTCLKDFMNNEPDYEAYKARRFADFAAMEAAAAAARASAAAGAVAKV